MRHIRTEGSFLMHTWFFYCSFPNILRIDTCNLHIRLTRKKLNQQLQFSLSMYWCNLHTILCLICKRVLLTTLTAMLSFTNENSIFVMQLFATWRTIINFSLETFHLLICIDLITSLNKMCTQITLFVVVQFLSPKEFVVRVYIAILRHRL